MVCQNFDPLTPILIIYAHKSLPEWGWGKKKTLFVILIQFGQHCWTVLLLIIFSFAKQINFFSINLCHNPEMDWCWSKRPEMLQNVPFLVARSKGAIFCGTVRKVDGKLIYLVKCTRNGFWTASWLIVSKCFLTFLQLVNRKWHTVLGRSELRINFVLTV